MKKCTKNKKKSVKKELPLVMIRTYSAGVHFGRLVSRKGKEVKLKDAHRVFYWANACTLSQLSVDGSTDPSNKISMGVEEIILTEAIEVIKMSQVAFDSLTRNIWKK